MTLCESRPLSECPFVAIVDVVELVKFARANRVRVANSTTCVLSAFGAIMVFFPRHMCPFSSSIRRRDPEAHNWPAHPPASHVTHKVWQGQKVGKVHHFAPQSSLSRLQEQRWGLAPLAFSKPPTPNGRPFKSNQLVPLHWTRRARSNTLARRGWYRRCCSATITSYVFGAQFGSLFL